MELLKELYASFGSGYPKLSVFLAALIGAAIFGISWWLIGKQYDRDFRAKTTQPTLGKKPFASRPLPAAKKAAVPNENGERAAHPLLGMSLEELNEKYNALNGRFAEQEAFVREMSGKSITWTVEVLSVGKCPPGVCLTFLSTAHNQLSVTTAEFDMTFAERLYALRPGDKIKLDGKLKPNVYGNILSVEAVGYELVPQ